LNDKTAGAAWPAQQNRLRHSEAERLGGFEVDGHVKFDWQLNGKVRRLFAPENAIHIRRRTTKDVHGVGSVGQQTVVSCKARYLTYRRYRVSGCWQYDLRVMDERECIHAGDETASRLAPKRGYDPFDFGVAANGRSDRLHLERSGSGLE
jgi:hypothetical protein